VLVQLEVRATSPPAKGAFNCFDDARDGMADVLASFFLELELRLVLSPGSLFLAPQKRLFALVKAVAADGAGRLPLLPCFCILRWNVVVLSTAMRANQLELSPDDPALQPF
jgi:hypothetical protein